MLIPTTTPRNCGMRGHCQHHHFHKHQSPWMVLHHGHLSQGWTKQRSHLEMCREGSHMCACTCPVPAEPKTGVRMQKTPRNTKEQTGEVSEGKKRHFLKCTSYFIPMTGSARHPIGSVVGADTNHCIISRMYIWDQLILSTAVKAACPGKAYQFNPTYRAPGLSFPTCATELLVYIHEQWSYY